MTEQKDLLAKRADTSPFHREVGELVFWFAGAENTVYMLARGLIGSHSVSTVVMANFHLEKAIDVVRKLAKAKHKDSPHLAAFEAGLLTLKDCARERNSLLHSVALPEIDAGSGEEVIRLSSLRNMKQMKKERGHVAQLRERVRKCSIQFMQAALDMKLWSKKMAK